MPATLVELSDLLLSDTGTQARAHISDPTVEEYAAALFGGGELPPLDIFPDGRGKYWVGDGWHRALAYKKARMKVIQARLHNGGRSAAVLFAARANEKHGLRKTPEDRRRAASLLLADPEWYGRSDSWVAEAAGVALKDVQAIRKEVGGPATAEYRDAQVRKRRGAPEQPPALLDPLGQPVPQHLNDAFAAAHVIRAARKALGKLDGLACLPDLAHAVLAQATATLARHEPAAVCPDCAGSGCEAGPCGGKGWVTVREYDGLRPGQKRKCERFKV